MFYKFFAQSRIIYGLLVCDTDAKTNLMKTENAQQKVIRAIFHREKFETLSIILEVLEVINMYTVWESPLRLLVKWTLWTMYQNSKGLERTFPTWLYGCIPKIIVEFTYTDYNWLAEINLLPSNLRESSQFHVEKLISEVSSKFNDANRDLSACSTLRSIL